MNFGRRFKLYRINNHLTQKEAADLLGIKSYQLANYESNRSEPSLKVLIGMSRVYGTSIDRLLGNTKLQQRGPTDEELELQEAERREFEKKLKELLEKYDYPGKR